MKRACGKQWFYSMGWRSIASDYEGPHPDNWPHWATRAFLIGRDDALWDRTVQSTKILESAE